MDEVLNSQNQSARRSAQAKGGIDPRPADPGPAAEAVTKDDMLERGFGGGESGDLRSADEKATDEDFKPAGSVKP